MKRWLYPFTSILFLAYPFIIFAQVDLNKGLMAYYPFNGNANDASGNGNNPIFNNTTLTTDYYGNAARACQFNGINTYIEIPNSNTLSLGNTISICAWVKPTGFYYGNCHGNNVLMKGDNDFASGNYMLRFDDAMYTGTNCDGGIPDTIHQTYYGMGTGLSPVQDTPYAQKNIWRSVVYTYDGSHARLYIDCNLVLDSEQPGLSFSNGDNLIFGKLKNVQFPYWLNAVLDEVRIYNRALNEDEVKAYSLSCAKEQSCSNWLKVNQDISGVQIGDFDVPGNKITVEALINRDTPYPDLYDGGDVVSKHDNPGDANYLLRPTVGQITTTNGFFETKRACKIELNKTYHIAMVYDGKTLKFYRNGFLMSQVPALGNLYQNNWITKIGTTANTGSPYPADFIGYINEVRIWNVARSQSDIKKYMNQSLPNPSSQTGLLAYYTFDDLKNKQGNAQWNGSILGNAQINKSNPTCSSFIADSCGTKLVNVTAGFTGSDTVCLNTPVQFNNTSAEASNYYWSFCSAFKNVPKGKTINISGNVLNRPVFSDFGLDNGNYYSIVTNHLSGHVTRLNFGNSLLNTPTAEDLGNFSGIVPAQVEGVQVLHVNGKWYAIAVGGGNEFTNSDPRIVKLDFGNSLANTPVATNWGNIGELDLPIDFYIAEENNQYYGFTMNVYSNTITRFDFGSDFINPPSGTNLGNIGNLDYPDGFTFVRNNTGWYSFAVNTYSNAITRLNFGSSLTNTPTATVINNPGNLISSPRDIAILSICDEIYGYVLNADNEMIKLNFGSDITAIPTATNLGNMGNFTFPHSFSDFFREGNSIYTFVPDVNSNSMSIISFSGCTNIPGSSKQNPDAVSYDQPGNYTVNLMVDIGLPTQTSYCKQITVIDCDTVCNIKADFKYVQNACDGKSIRFLSTTLNADSIWWDFGNGITAGNISDTIIEYKNFGNYIVKLFAKTTSDCLDTAEYTINLNIVNDSAIINNDTSVCAGNSIQLNAIEGINYCWSPSAGLSNAFIQNPIASPVATTKYYLHILTDSVKPVIMDSVTIVLPSPDVYAGKDASVCKGDSVELNASGAINYIWKSSPYLSDSTIANPIAAPSETTSFVVKGYNTQGCFDTDTVDVSILPSPIVSLTNDTAVCTGGSVLLNTGSNVNNTYSWMPSAGLSNTVISNPVASPVNATKYFVKVTDENNCVTVDSVMVDVLLIPKVSTLSDTSSCLNTPIKLVTNASNATIFQWSPSTGLDNPGTQNPIALPASSRLYTVIAGNGICSEEDSVLISVLPLPNIKASNDTTVCGNAFVQLNASGAISYSWTPLIDLSDWSIANPIAVPKVNTTYYVKGIDNNGCSNTDSVIISVLLSPAFSVIPLKDTICAGDFATLTAAGGDTYKWLPEETVLSPSEDITKVFPSTNTSYSVIITNTACKVTDTLYSEISVKSLPVLNITKSNDIDCINPEAQLVATGGLRYKWSPSTYINSIAIYNPVVNPHADAWYIVESNGSNGCTNKDSILVKSNYNPEAAKFEIATAFTPNHDGVNDCFSVKYWGPADLFDMSIYNRWGELIFHSNNINACWDGTYKGMPQAIGTYIYQISVSTNCSEGLLHKKGTLVLMR